MEFNDRQAYSPKLSIADFYIVNKLIYLMRFFPMTYISDAIFSESNKVGSFKASFKEILSEEFIRFLGLLYAMEVVKFPSLGMHWENVAVI